MAIKIYAGKTDAQLESPLPSPADLKRTDEQIWSENTGRDTSSSAAMVGDSVAEKKTFAISWGVITQSELDRIRSHMPRGFFTFKIAQGGSTEKIKAYRSNIDAEYLCEQGGVVYYKSASVEVIEK